MKSKKEPVNKEKNLLPNKKLIIISTALVTVIFLGAIFFLIFLQTPELKFSLKAAIIDQLEAEFLNSEFNQTGIVSNILETAGFNVSYFRSETVDVAFFKKLAKYNFGIIILRAHSALREDKTLVDFFTSEKYKENEYVSEQQNGLLTAGYYSWKPGTYYFAITPKFIENLEGYFPKSIVITMGCNSLNVTCTEMAEAFIKKGAKAYIGWTGLVEPSHTDNETVKLLGKLLVENRTLNESVSATRPDPLFYLSRMNYYPLEAGNLTIAELVNEAKTLTLQIGMSNFEKTFFAILLLDVALFPINRILDLIFLQADLLNHDSVLTP
jgi:hypothetical protein